MNKTFNEKYQVYQITIYPGEVYISRRNEIVSTILGSCVSVCLYDRKTGLSGMNHFMLPGQTNTNISCTIRETKLTGFRYGEIANVELLNQMLSLGAKIDNIEGGIYGGASIIPKIQIETLSIGQKNILCAVDFLKENNIPVKNEDVGCNYGRRIQFNTGSNKILSTKIDAELSFKQRGSNISSDIKCK